MNSVGTPMQCPGASSTPWSSFRIICARPGWAWVHATFTENRVRKKKRLVNLGIRDRLCHALEVGDLICRSRGPSRAGEQDNYAALTKETEQSQELFRRAHLVPKARRQERPPLLGDVTPRYGSTTLTGHANVLRPQLGKLPDSPAGPADVAGSCKKWRCRTSWKHVGT